MLPVPFAPTFREVITLVDPSETPPIEAIMISVRFPLKKLALDTVPSAATLPPVTLTDRLLESSVVQCRAKVLAEVAVNELEDVTQVSPLL